ncbi:TIGR02147 family protein [Chitinispirillales bacterium ANBcel5]|uniref:TIGR02147 family protein n=1 Tax=Cellulosispirillum alkaliphilum TaxID=3039283 RepID=UPI002A53E260|nr:TIGR02147 family protein [Chitinispirillales bacterium ANBcel5]
MIPTIFNYTDYREYLTSVFNHKKDLNPKFSHRLLALKLGLKAPGHMLLVMQGKRRLTFEIAEKIVKWLRLNQKESDYFFQMLCFNHAITSKEKQIAYEEMISLRNHTVKVANTRFYEKWYYSAIRSALNIIPFSGDYSALATGLIPPITIDQAKEAVKILTTEGFIAQDQSGYFYPSDPFITSGEKWKSDTIKSLRYQFLDLGRESLERFEPEKRDVSFLTVTLSEKSFEKVRKKVEKLRAEILSVASTETKPDRVVQCNLALFPLFEKDNDQ